MKITNEQILELHSKGLSDKDIAISLNANKDTVIRRRFKLGLKANNYNKSYILSEKEIEVIIGTLLGDSCVRYVYDGCVNPMLTFTHCEKQKEWFDWKCKALSSIMSSNNGYKKFSSFKKEYVIEYQFTGKNMSCLNEIRNEFYKNNVKIIPISFIKDKISELSIYCLYMDDGSYDIHTNSYILNTQCFKKENLKEFVNILEINFNLKFNIKSDNTLYLKHESNEIFKNILLKFNECDSMKYKISKECRHKIPLNGISPEVDDLPC